MPSTLHQPRYWLVIGLEWPNQATDQYAECALALAPSFIPTGVLSRPAYVIFELARNLAPEGEQQVVMFSELTQALRRKKYDWSTVGVPDWEATVNELAEAPIPALFLTLSQYAHFMLCTAGMDNAYVHGPDGQQLRVPETDYEDLRSSLRTMLVTDWPDYIQKMEQDGKFRPPPQ